MSLVKKHAALLTVLSVIFAAVAAPYLIPENPDSSHFRFAAFMGFLFLCCAYPAYEALKKADRRTLICSCVWGFLFAAALSLGSELFCYNGLLSGVGSMIRRLAVPVMITPFFGCLCARLMMITPGTSNRKKIPFALFFIVILLCWIPLLLAYFPGMINYDFVGEFMQHVEQAYSSIHPLLHSALMNGVIALGEALGSRTAGLLMMSILQMTVFAASLAYACSFAQKHGAPLFALILMTAFFALHPVFSVMSLSMTKDTLFAAAILVLSLEVFSLIESPDSFLASKPRWILFVFLTVNAALMRNNGIFALALMFPAIVIVLRSHCKQTVLLCACGAAASLLTLAGLKLMLNPTSLPSFQLYSLPAQQLVRAYNTEKMSPEDKAELESWYTSAYGLVVHPHLGDGAKGYLDRPRIEAEGEEFLSLWKRVSKDCMHEYIEALLMLNVGSWYPDDLSHSTIYPDASWNDKGYLQTHERNMHEYGIHSTSILPGVRNLYEQICRRNRYQKYPVISILFCTATPFWVLLFACARLIARKKSCFLPSALGAIGLWLSYLLGPCTLPRYILPLFCLAPVLLCLAYTHHSSHPHGKEAA